MIKVIASDMDGTLLGDNHKVAPETVEAIREAQAAGIRWTRLRYTRNPMARRRP